jgi:hypothetical protein
LGWSWLTQYGQIVWYLINHKAQASPFQKYMLSDKVWTNVQPLDWWKSQFDRLHPDKITVANQQLQLHLLVLKEFFIVWLGAFEAATVWGLKNRKLCVSV